ncbi:MAG: hypothetical protein LBS60_09115 [Deltaproteobacteria bacterium]|jgi:hypothetical protein|nr:hypothetical protein [Deltaproteobacteria bacterium]
MEQKIERLETAIRLIVERLIPELRKELVELVANKSRGPKVTKYRKRTYADYKKYNEFRGMGQSIRNSATLSGIPYSAGIFYERATADVVYRLKMDAEAEALAAQDSNLESA